MTKAVASYRDILRKLDDIDAMQHGLAEDTQHLAPLLPLSNLITRFAEVKNLHARLKEIAADIDQLAQHLSTQLVPDAMRAAGFTTVNHVVGRVSLSSQVSASMVDKHGAISWLKGHDLGDLVIETVNSQTLCAQAKTMLEAGDELPAEYFKVHYRTITKIIPPGPKGQRKFRPLDDVA